MTKPPDCNCGYPVAVARTSTGHAPNCLAHKRILANMTDPRLHGGRPDENREKRPSNEETKPV